MEYLQGTFAREQIADLAAGAEILYGIRLQCVALIGNGIKSKHPPMVPLVRIRATRSYAFGTFLHHYLYFSFNIRFFVIFPVIGAGA